MHPHALSRRECLTVSAAGGSLSLAGLVRASRPYRRINMICGTAGTFCDYSPRIFLDGHGADWETDMAPYHAQYGHPLWKKLSEVAQQTGGHGGMDYIMNWCLIQCLREGLPLDMTVYDAAAWSSVFPLSIASVAQGSAPLAVPDFTRGDWQQQAPLGIVEA